MQKCVDIIVTDDSTRWSLLGRNSEGSKSNVFAKFRHGFFEKNVSLKAQMMSYVTTDGKKMSKNT